MARKTTSTTKTAARKTTAAKTAGAVKKTAATTTAQPDLFKELLAQLGFTLPLSVFD